MAHEHTVRYALNTSTIRPQPLLRKIEIAAAAGYEGIELWHEDIEAFLSEGGSLEAVRGALRSGNLRLASTIYLGGWFDASIDEYPAIRARCQQRLETAAALGAENVIAGPPGGLADPQPGAARYRELLDVGDRVGTRPAFEFLGFVAQYNTAAAALEVVRLSKHPRAATVMDPFHVVRGGGRLEALPSIPPAEIPLSHFNDLPATVDPARATDADRVLPGDGDLDLTAYLSWLLRQGFDGWLSLELFNERLWGEDPLEVARTGLDRMRSLVRRA